MTTSSAVTKWNASLPSFLHKPLEKEQIIYREQIFSQLSEIREKSSESNDATILLLSTLRLLHRYTSICHFRLSIQEKEKLVRILYDILVDPHTEPALQSRIAQHMIRLLKSKDGFSEEFSVPWRPLWDLIHRYYFKTNDVLRYMPPPSHAANIRTLIWSIKKYFSVEATDEILAEAKPLLCVFDHMYAVGMGLMTLFLPVSRRHNHAKWMNIVMAHWELTDSNPVMDYCIITLLARLAIAKCGEVDFSPYYDLIFTNLLRIFDLPIGGSPGSHYNKYPVQMCQFFVPFQEAKSKNIIESAKLLIWILKDEGNYDDDIMHTEVDVSGVPFPADSTKKSDANNPTCFTAFDHLKQTMRSIASFYHPSNAARCTPYLFSFLFNIMHRFSRRLLWERDERNTQPKDSKLSQQFVQAFVKSMLPITRQSIFAKSEANSRVATHAVKHLCFAAPEVCFPSLIELITGALTTLVHAHQAPTVLNLLNVCFSPIFSQLDRYPEALNYLPELLGMCLNGLDSNDMIKTTATCEFFNTVFSLIPFVKPKKQSDDAPQIVYYYEEFCMQLLDRLFYIFKNIKDTESASDRQNFPYTTVHSLLYTMFSQLDDELFELCSKKVLRFIESNFLPGASSILGVCVRVASSHPDHPGKSLAPFIDFFYRRLLATEDNSGEKQTSLTEEERTLPLPKQYPKLASLTENEITYYVTLLSSCLKTHPGVGAHREKLTTIFRALFFHCSLKSEKKMECVLTSLLFYSSLHSLALIYLKEGRSLTPSVWKSEAFQNRPFDFYGKMLTLEETKPEWHEPSEEELDFAVALWNEFSTYCVDVMQQYTKDPRSVPLQILRNFLTLTKYLCQGAIIFMPEASTDTRKEYRLRMYRKNEQPTTGDIRVSEDRLKYNRESMAAVLRDLYRAVQKDEGNNDVKAVVLIGECIHTMMCHKYISFKEVTDKRRNIEKMKNTLFKSSNPAGRNRYPRVLQLKRLKFHFYSRLCLRDIKYPKLFDDLMDIFEDMCVSHYSKIRRTGQAMLASVLRLFNRNLFSDRMIPLLEKLSNKELPEEHIKGICHLLRHHSVLKRIFSRWDTLAALMKNYIRIRVEKQTNQQLVAGLFPVFAKSFVELKLHNEEDERMYFDTVQSLLSALDENEHWRTKAVTLGAINLFVRSDRKVMFPTEGIFRVFALLDSDMLTVRTSAASAMSLLLAQHRPRQLRKVLRTNGQRLSVEDQRKINESYAEVERGAGGDTMQNDDTMQDDDTMRDENTPQNTLTKQWHNISYLDKNYLGWECLPLKLSTFDYSQGTKDSSAQHIQQARERLAAGLRERMDILQSFSNRLCQLPGLHFNSTLARILKMLFQIIGPESITIARSLVENLLTSDTIGSGKPEEKSTCTQVAHFLAGLNRASKHWTPMQIESCRAFTKQTLEDILWRMTPQCIGDFKQFFNFIVYDLDPRRVYWLLEWLHEVVNNLPPQVSAVQESMWYRYINNVLGEVSWRAPAWNRIFFDHTIERLVAHPHAKVREVAASFLTMFYRHDWMPQREIATDKQQREQQLEVQQDKSCARLKLASSIPHTDIHYHAMESEDAKVCDPESFSLLNYQITTLLDTFYKAYKKHVKESKDVNDPESRELLQVSHTVAMFVAIMFQTSNPSIICPFLDKLLDVLVQMSFMTHDPELQKIVRTIVLHLASSIFPKSTTRHLLRSLEKQMTYSHPEAHNTVLLQHTDWRLKNSILSILQSFVFRHQFFLLDYQSALIEMLLELMKDKSTEVKHHSMQTLAGFLLIAPEKQKEDMANRFLKVHSKLKAKKKKEKTAGEKYDYDKDKLQYLTLGLSSIVLAHPYSVPEFLPRVLVLLSEYQHIDTFVDKELKDTFSEFWKTHQDEWHTRWEKMFTDDEKYAIRLTLSAPYFA